MIPTYTQDTVWTIPPGDGDDRALLREAGARVAALVCESAALAPGPREAFLPRRRGQDRRAAARAMPKGRSAMSDELHYITATEAIAAFKARTLSPVELMDAMIARIEAINDSLNAFTYTFFDRARDQGQGGRGRL